jgi:hypothetical protein
MRLKYNQHKNRDVVTVNSRDYPFTIIDTMLWLDDNFDVALPELERSAWKSVGPNFHDVVNVRNLPRAVRLFGNDFEVETQLSPSELEVGLIGLGIGRIEEGQASQVADVETLLKRLDVCRKAGVQPLQLFI